MICVHCHTDNKKAAKSCESCGESPLLVDRYRLNSVIGEGAAATLYQAWDTKQKTTVAVKERHPAGRLDAAASELFQRESKILRQLKHPRIPAYVDAFAAGSGRAKRHYLIQTLVQGDSLDKEMASRRYTELEVLAILKEIAEILAYLHRLSPPVIHRDLKPGNVMRRTDEALILVDFGAVRGHIAGTLGGQTVAGTFGFMAPEQFMGDATPASDIYALGALAVALLSREDPAKLHDLQRRFRWERAVKVSEPVKALLTSMLSEDPTARPTAATLTRWPLDTPELPATTKTSSPTDTGALDKLAEKGRRKLRRQRERAEKEAIAKATRGERDAEKRLNDGLVGPITGLFLRQQMIVQIGVMMVCLLGSAYGTGQLFENLLSDILPDWTAFPTLLIAIAMGFYLSVHVPDWVLSPIARSASRRERDWLARLPVPIVLDDYLVQMSEFQHSGYAMMTVTLNKPLPKKRLATLNEALQGSRLGGYATKQKGEGGAVLLLRSKEMDLSTLHGKRLEHAVSHYSLIHNWNRKVLNKLLIPARDELGIQSVRLQLKKT